jgi:hypothetical protein
VILVSSNPVPAPKYLRIDAMVRRDTKFIATITRHVSELLARRRSQAGPA